jgi:hypothetical protein
LHCSEIAVVEELFTYGCPKFVSPVAISFDADHANQNQEMLRFVFPHATFGPFSSSNVKDIADSKLRFL